MYETEEYAEQPIDCDSEAEPNEDDKGAQSFHWTTESVFFLLDAYKSRLELFRNTDIKRVDLYYDIQEEMQANGFKVTEADSIDRKLRNLKSVYKRCLQDQIDGKAITWEYFQKVGHILFNQPQSSEEFTTKRNTPKRPPPAPSSSQGGEKWPLGSVECLLEAYDKRKEQFCLRTTKKKNLWTEIHHEMRAKGFHFRSKDVLDRKWRNLKKTFRVILKKVALGGTHRWPYFEKMQEIFSGRFSLEFDDDMRLTQIWREDSDHDDDDSSASGAQKGEPCAVNRQDSSAPFRVDTIVVCDSQKGPTEFEHFKKSNSSSHQIRTDPLIIKERREKVADDVNAVLKESRYLLKQRDQLLRKLNIPAEQVDVPTEICDPTPEIKKEIYDELRYDNNENDCGQIRLNQSGTFIFVCGFCRGKYDSLIDFASHLKEQHTNFLQSTIALESLSCTKIEEMPPDGENNCDYEYKMEEKENNDTHICICGKSFNCEEDLRIHKCNSIDKKNSQISAEQSEPKAVRDDEILPTALSESRECKFCRMEFDTRKQRTEHEKIHNVVDPYVCWFCQQTFRTPEGRKYHIRVHTGERPFKCQHCSKYFLKKRLLASHINREHVKTYFECRKCGQKYGTKESLKRHERRHGGPRNCICEQCGKTYSTISALKCHLKRHAGNPDVICKVCGKAFFKRVALRQHMTTHTDHTPYECEICGRKFNRPSALKVHLRLHSEQQLHVCHLCGKEYIAKSSLLAHMKWHRKKREAEQNV